MQNAGKSSSFLAKVCLKFGYLGVLALGFGFGVSTTYADTTIIPLYSGTFEGDRPSPARVGKVSRRDRFQIEVGKVSALVNYADSNNPIVIERVINQETGAKISCPWFMKMDGKTLGERVNATHTATATRKVFCEVGGCTDFMGQPIPKSDLLFGKYYLPKVTSNTGQDLGFYDTHWVTTPITDCPKGDICGPKIDSYPIYCPEFTIERTFSEMHYFDHLLIVPNFWEQDLIDLDVDFRKIYLTFENEKQDRATCVLTDLVTFGDTIEVGDLKDCILPPGDRFTMYAQSRFYLKDTRACGKFVAKGVWREDHYIPDWFMGWYECDGKADRSPIEKQFTYSTRLELKFTQSNLGEK